MTEQAALLAAICAEPEDDTPRLAFADWLDENATSDTDRERAAFIRDQVALTRIPEWSPDAASYLLRQELQTRTGIAEYTRRMDWLADLAAASKLETRAFEFRRGFPDRIAAAEAVVLADGDRAFDLAPVTDLRLQQGQRDQLPTLLRQPWLARLRRLRIDGSGYDDYGVLADCPHLANLESLWISNGYLTPAGLSRVGRSPHLGGLRELTLDEVHADNAAMGLADPGVFPRLERLHVTAGGSNAEVWEAIAAGRGLPRLTSLTISYQRSLGGWQRGQFDAASARAVTRSAFWPNLRHLGVWASNLTDEPLVELATAPNPPAPTPLELQSNALTEVGLAALAESPLLRGATWLRLNGNRIGTAGVVALAESPFAGNLGGLHIDGSPLGPRGAEALARSRNLPRLFALSASRCEFGDEGFGHLAASPLLDQLVSLYVGERDSTPAVKALLGPRMGDRVRF